MSPYRLFVLALIGSVGFAVAHASAESEESEQWNQEKVTRVAADLAAQMRDLVSDPGLEPTQATAMQQREHHAAVLTVRRLAKLADDLAARLQLGQGYQQTRPIFEEVQLLRQEIVAYAGNSWIAPETRMRIEGIQKILTVLTYFYQSR
jgi:hypothetical protein